MQAKLLKIMLMVRLCHPNQLRWHHIIIFAEMYNSLGVVVLWLFVAK